MAKAHETGRCNLCKKNTSDFTDMDDEWLNPFASRIPYVTKMINICSPCYIEETWESIKSAEKIKDIEAYKSTRLLDIFNTHGVHVNPANSKYNVAGINMNFKSNRLNDFGQK